MFNAREIIELEKKWLKYKIKQKSKLYIFFILFILIVSALAYQFYIQNKSNTSKTIVSKIIKKTVPAKSEHNKSKKHVPIEPIVVKEKNSTNKDSIASNESVVKIQKVKQVVLKQKKDIINTKEYYLKIEPTEQANELFSSNGFVNFNSPIKEKREETKKTITPINKIQNEEINIVKEKKKSSIKIEMKEMNTIAYLKEKFYATSSIVFALMLSEEFYYDKKYNESLKWALTANDIDSQNTKTWYWFAKSKVKLDKKEDAIRALKAYLSNNESKRLTTLLHKIELGDTDD